MKVIVALLALAALVASAHATCYCNQLSGISGNSCTIPVGTAPTGFTYKAGSAFIGGTGQCKNITASDNKTLSDLAKDCTPARSCKGFSIANSANGHLSVCYYSQLPTVDTTQSVIDARCYGLYTIIPPVVTPSTECCDKYGIGSGAYWKCLDCKNTANTNKATPAQCCSCPVTTKSDATNCIDCVVTANVKDKDSCAPCSSKYSDGTNALIRCWECVKLANGRPALNPASGTSFTSQADQCVKFCSSFNPTLPDPTECLDCTKDSLAGKFHVLGNNPNGQCPSSGRKQL